MKTIRGPAISLSRFIGDEEPFNHLESISEWSRDLGYEAIELPICDPRFFDIDLAAESVDYCEALMGELAEFGVELCALSSFQVGQLVASHPAYDRLNTLFAPDEAGDSLEERAAWATAEMQAAAQACGNLGLTVHATVSGALMWHTAYPRTRQPEGLAQAGFEELARRWRPILSAFDDAGVDLCFRLQPGQDLHDGASFERFLDACDYHPRINLLYDPGNLLVQQMDYLAHIDLYRERMRMFHVHDAEFNPSARAGVYGGYQEWEERPARFRSPGDGQVDFISVFSKLAQYDYDGWATLAWECCLKDPLEGAREGAPFIREMIVAAPEIDPDLLLEEAQAPHEPSFYRRLLGLE